jgi:hypothetical protein
MSEDEKLAGFKISDVKRAEVRTYKSAVPKDQADEPSEQGPSTGFASIEQRLENASIEAVADEIRSTYEKLEEMAGQGDMKAKAAAQKSMAAYERTADLFEYLFATKTSIQEQ